MQRGMFFFQSARVDVYFKLFLISVFQNDYLKCFSPCVCFLNGEEWSLGRGERVMITWCPP